jgi:hypothetical protein
VTSPPFTTIRTVRYGNYDWRVLEERDGKTLLFSDRIISSQRYHNTLTDITWEESDIRRWLNNDFLYSFNAVDKARIIPTNVVNNDNLTFDTPVPGGADTIDYIFLLSIEESMQLGAGNSIRVAHCMNISCCTPTSTQGHEWWLRSPGSRTIRAMHVRENGVQVLGGMFVNQRNMGIRPAMWVDLSDIDITTTPPTTTAVITTTTPPEPISPTILDALENLKRLAGLPSTVPQEVAVCICDALEILKYLAGLPNNIRRTS